MEERRYKLIQLLPKNFNFPELAQEVITLEREEIRIKNSISETDLLREVQALQTNSELWSAGLREFSVRSSQCR